MNGAKIHVASLMDICHLKNADLETKHQKYKGRVVLRGDIVKDDSGPYAVFTDQRSSASQMTAAKVMDIISRLPGCAGQAADAIYACTQVKMKDAPKIIENSKIGMSRNLDSSTTTQNGQNHGPIWKTQSFLLSEICTVILWQDCYGKRQFGKILLKYGWEKVSNWECLFVHREKRIFFSVHVDDIKLAGKKQNNWSIVESTQRSRFGRTNIFPWSCIPGMYSKTMWNEQRYCWQSQNHVWITNFRGKNWKTTCSENQSISSWSHDMESHAKKCVEQYCELTNKTTQQLYKVYSPCIDDIISKKKNKNPWKNCQKYALKLFWNACTWHVLEDLMFSGQWTIFARSKRLARFDLLHSSHMWIQTGLLCG